MTPLNLRHSFRYPIQDSFGILKNVSWVSVEDSSRDLEIFFRDFFGILSEILSGTPSLILPGISLKISPEIPIGIPSEFFSEIL